MPRGLDLDSSTAQALSEAQGGVVAQAPEPAPVQPSTPDPIAQVSSKPRGLDLDASTSRALAEAVTPVPELKSETPVYDPRGPVLDEPKKAQAQEAAPKKATPLLPAQAKQQSKAPGWPDWLPAFASAVPEGAMKVPEQGLNLLHYAQEHAPQMGKIAAYATNPALGMLTEPSTTSPIIDVVNKISGASPQKYANATDQYRRTPQPWLGGKRPEQVQEGHPIASMAGEFTGALPYAFIPMGGEGAGLLGAAAKGGALGVGFTGYDEAARQVKDDDEINLQRVLDAAQQGFLPGMLFGVGAKMLHGLVGKRAPKEPPVEHGGDYDMQVRRALSQADEFRQSNKPIVGTANQSIDPTAGVVGKRVRQLSPEEARQRFAETTKRPIAGAVSGAPTQVRKEVHAEIKESPAQERDSWRDWRDQRARQARPEEQQALAEMAYAKVRMDEAGAKLEGAILEADPDAMTRFLTYDISPEGYAKLEEYIQSHGMKRTAMTEPFMEAALSREHEFKPEYKFKSQDAAGQEKELRALLIEFLDARQDYEFIRQQATADVKLPINDTIQVAAKDSANATRHVNVGLRQRAKAGAIRADETRPDAAAVQEGYEKTRAQVRTEYTQPFERTFERFIRETVPGSAEMIQNAFKDIPQGLKTKALFGIGLTLAYYLSNQGKAEAAEPPSPELLQGIIKQVTQGGREFLESRPLTRVTTNEVTSDIIRKGFDAQSRAFGQKRDAYLAALKRILAGSREPNEEELKGIAKMTATQIKDLANQRNPERRAALKDWSAQEISKLSDARRAHAQYTKDLRAEIKRLEGMGAASPKGFSAGTLFGKGRYNRMLHLDLADMTGAYGMPHPNLMGHLTGNFMKSTFLGNWRSSSMHLGEALVSTFSKHPIAAGEAMIGFATDPIYQEFATMNTPTRGMMQQILEESKGMGLDKLINQQIDKAVAKIPGGKAIYDTMSAQIIERGKLGFVSLVNAQHNAKAYPGGVKAYMQDWIAFSKTGSPPAHPEKFAEIELKTYIEDNRAIMYMPDGPLKERTMYQRHGDVVRMMFPFLRAVTQQARFVAGLADDMLANLAKGDMKAAAGSLSSFLAAHVLIAGAAGSHALPGYVWDAFDKIDKEKSKTLRNMIDDRQMALTNSFTGGHGFQVQDFGVKYLPFLRASGIVTEGEVGKIARGIMNPKNPKAFMDAAIDLTAMQLVSHIGPEGTGNLRYMIERVAMGVKGKEHFKRYREDMLVEKAMGRDRPTKTVDTWIKHFDIPQGIGHALFKIENADEQKAIERGEKRGQRMQKRDYRKMGRAQEKVRHKIERDGWGALFEQ